MREPEREPQHARKLGTESAGTEQGDRGRSSGDRRCLEVVGQAALESGVTEQRHDLEDMLRKVLVFAAIRVSPKRPSSEVIRSRSATDAKIDSPRMESFEHGELFRDNERCVVGQHDAARPKTDAVG